MATRAVRGRVLTFTEDGHRYLADGVVLVRDGVIEAVGDAAELLPRLPAGTAVDRYPDQLILPGLIDPHIHFPQMQVIASYGASCSTGCKPTPSSRSRSSPIPAHAARIARASSSTS